MKFLFFNHDGNSVSGIFSYCKMLLTFYPDCLTLSLNEEIPGFDPSWGDRFLRIPFEQSHDIQTIINAIDGMARRFPNDALILLPNNGEIPFIACLEAMKSRGGPQGQLRILAIVHSDHRGSYAMPLRYNLQVTKFIGVSQTITDCLHTLLPERKQDIFFLPYPVQITPLCSQTEPTQTVPLRLLYAGRLEENQKRVSRLPLLAARLGEFGIPFTLDIFGEGEASASLSQSLSELPGPTRDQVRLHGAVAAEEIHRLLPGYDLLLLVSSYEGTPLILLEAMASGLCPLVMDIESGIPDLIVNGVHGIIIPQGDIAAMANAIGMLHNDRVFLDCMKQASRTLIANNYSISNHLYHLNKIGKACSAMPQPPPAESVSTPNDASVKMLSRLDRSSFLTIVVWGGGMYGRSVVDACLRQDIQVCAIIDTDPKKRGRSYKGVLYMPPERLFTLTFTHILVGSIAFAEEICHQIEQLFTKADLQCPKIISLEDNRPDANRT